MRVSRSVVPVCGGTTLNPVTTDATQMRGAVQYSAVSANHPTRMKGAMFGPRRRREGRKRASAEAVVGVTHPLTTATLIDWGIVAVDKAWITPSTPCH